MWRALLLLSYRYQLINNRSYAPVVEKQTCGEHRLASYNTPQTNARARTHIHYYYYNAIFVRLYARCVRRDLMIFREPELIHIVLCVVYIVTVSLLWFFFSFLVSRRACAHCVYPIFWSILSTQCARLITDARVQNARQVYGGSSPSSCSSTYSLFNVFGAQQYYTDPFVRGGQKRVRQ